MSRILERRTRLVREYEQRGYSVSVEPSADSLPPEIRGLRPDLVARRADEVVVIELAGTQGPDTMAVAIARALEHLPGWRFEFIVVNDEPPRAKLSSASAGDTLTRLEIAGVIAETQHLIMAGHYAGAILLGWAALEAALRLRLPAVDPGRGIPPRQLIKTAFSEGLLTRADLDQLEKLLSMRTRLAHGLRATAPDATECKLLLDTVDRALQGLI